MSERTTAGPRPTEPATQDATIRPFQAPQRTEEVAMTATEPSAPAGAQSITEQELAQCQRANQTGRPPVVFVHGLWLLPSSWDRWSELFEANGFVALTPGWPDDPDTAEEVMAHPEVFAHKTVGQVADHVQAIIGGLDTKPAIIPGVTEIVELKGRGHALTIDAAGARSPTPPWPSSSASPTHRLLGCPSGHSVAAA